MRACVSECIFGLPLAARGLLAYAATTMKHLTLLCAFILFMATSALAAGKLNHVVSFKFKSTATSDEIKKVETAFEALKKNIPEIVSLEWGTNVSKENKDKGFTHCFILTFKSEKDRDAYINHPEHKAFGKIVHGILEDAFVIDFLSKD